VPVWLQILLTAIVIPGAGFSVKVLYGVGKVMGKIDQKLTNMNDRVERLEDTVYNTPAPSSTVTRRRRTTP